MVSMLSTFLLKSQLDVIRDLMSFIFIVWLCLATSSCLWTSDTCCQYTDVSCCCSWGIWTWARSIGGHQEQPETASRRICCVSSWEVGKWEVIVLWSLVIEVAWLSCTITITFHCCLTGKFLRVTPGLVRSAASNLLGFYRRYVFLVE